MVPCDTLPEGLPNDVVTRLEVLLRQSAWYTRVGFCFALWFVENATSLLFLEWGRFSRIDLSRARHRFRRLAHHRLDILVLVAKLLKSLVAIYSDAGLSVTLGIIGARGDGIAPNTAKNWFRLIKRVQHLPHRSQRRSPIPQLCLQKPI